MINDRARTWLQAKFKGWKSLWDDKDWDLEISPMFDRCKRAFDGQNSLQMYTGNSHVEIPPFVPIKNIPQLDLEQKADRYLRGIGTP